MFLLFLSFFYFSLFFLIKEAFRSRVYKFYSDNIKSLGEKSTLSTPMFVVQQKRQNLHGSLFLSRKCRNGNYLWDGNSTLDIKIFSKKYTSLVSFKTRIPNTSIFSKRFIFSAVCMVLL